MSISGGQDPRAPFDWQVEELQDSVVAKPIEKNGFGSRQVRPAKVAGSRMKAAARIIPGEPKPDSEKVSERKPSPAPSATSNTAPSATQGPNKPPAKRKPRPVGKVLLAGALIIGGQQVFKSVTDSSRQGWAYTASRNILPRVGLGKVFFAHDRPTRICSSEKAKIEIPDFDTARKIVAQIPYLESDMDTLHNTLGSIENAKSVGEARAIAQDFLSERGIDSFFYSEGSDETVKFGDGYEVRTTDHPSDSWRVDEETQKFAISNFILGMSQIPKPMVQGWNDTVLLVGDNQLIQGTAGQMLVASPISKSGFVVSISLSVFEDRVDLDTIFHEIAHRDHASICGITDFDNDPAFVEINKDGDTRIPEAYVRDYPRDGGIAEDVADSWADTMTESVSSKNAPRSSGPFYEKQEVLLHRYAEQSGLSVEELLAFAEIQRIYGPNSHPLESIQLGIPPFIDVNAYLGEEDEDLVEFTDETPLGSIPTLCTTLEEGDQGVGECRVYVTAATISTLPEGADPRSWYEGLQTLLREVRPNSSCPNIGLNSSAGKYDPNFPQDTKGTLYFDRSDCYGDR